MEKELFIETIEKIKKQLEKDGKCHEAFSTILPNDYVSGYDYSLVLSQLIKHLKVEFKDEEEEEWIEYFIWDLDFGKKFKMGMIREKNGENIDLSDSEKLYEFLNKNNGK